MPIIPEQVEGFPWPDPIYSSVQPFTYRDGTTYLQILRALDVYVKNLADMVNKVNNDAGENIAGQIAALQAAVNDALAAQADNVNSELDSTTSLVQSELLAAMTELYETVENLTVDAAPKSVITYKQTSSGVMYNVVEAVGNNSIKKVLAPGFNSDGTVLRTARTSLSKLAKMVGAPVITNCDAGINTNTELAATQGINITGGVPYNGFDGAVSPEVPGVGVGIEALARYFDGTLRPIRAIDGKTAEQYVAEGVIDTYGYGPILVEDGVDTFWYNKPEFSFFADNKSARTMLGQRSDGTYIIVTVHGKSTPASGVSGYEMTELMLSEGCVVAVNLDGGGTTQLRSHGQAVHPSSDSIGYRPVLHAIAVMGEPVGLYDTGDIELPVNEGFTLLATGRYPATIRVYGSEVELNVNAKRDEALPFNQWVQLTAPNAIPEWMLPINFQESRGIITGNQGVMISWSVSTDRALSVRLMMDTTANTVSGVCKWRIKNYYGVA